jgi:hypothetical protein
MLANPEFKPYGFTDYEIAIVDTSVDNFETIHGACFNGSYAQTLTITFASMLFATGYYL